MVLSSSFSPSQGDFSHSRSSLAPSSKSEVEEGQVANRALGVTPKGPGAMGLLLPDSHSTTVAWALCTGDTAATAGTAVAVAAAESMLATTVAVAAGFSVQSGQVIFPPIFTGILTFPLEHGHKICSLHLWTRP